MYRISHHIQNYKYVWLYGSVLSRASTKLMAGLYKVERIVGKRIREGTIVEYKVKWKNYDSTQNTWQPLKNLKNVQDMVFEFQKRNKDKLPQLNIKTTQKTISKKNEVPSTAKKQSKPPKKDVFTKKTKPRMVVSDNEEQQDELNNNTKESQKNEASNLQSQSSIHLDENMLELNLNSIASRILLAAQEKKKTYKVVQIKKRTAGEGDLYILQDSEGIQEYKTRQEVLRDFSCQLIAYYQKRLKFSSQTKPVINHQIQ